MGEGEGKRGEILGCPAEGVSSGGSPKAGAPQGGAPKGGRPKISRFFSLTRHYFHSFFLSWGSSGGILVVFETPGPSNVHAWSSRAVV